MDVAHIILTFIATAATLAMAWLAFRGHRDRKRILTDLVNWDLCFTVAEDLLRRIKPWAPELVIGIGRSGGIWGGWMAGNLGSKPFAVVDDNYTSKPVVFPGGSAMLQAIRNTHPNIKKVLVVQGASSRGETLHRFKSEFAQELEGWKVRTAVLFVSTNSDGEINYVGRTGPEPWPERLPWHRSDDWERAMRRSESA